MVEQYRPLTTTRTCPRRYRASHTRRLTTSTNFQYRIRIQAYSRAILNTRWRRRIIQIVTHLTR